MIGDRQYELSNHLGNVLAVVTDKKIARDDDQDGVIDYYQPDVLTSMDYSPFGVMLEGRNWQSEEYRYGFNQMERDDEVKGAGNSYDFGARMLDVRLGRWLSIDPLANRYAQLSPYSFVRGNPLLFIDKDGRDWVLYTGTKIIYYAGKKGDKTTALKTYNATSGHKGFQYASDQAIKNNGPIPMGTYTVNLGPDPTRKTKLNSDGTTKPTRGIEVLDWRQGYMMSGWGLWRARLEPTSGTDTKGRSNFYLHDSYKGESSGCIECETDLYYDLVLYREAGNNKIEVVVEYSSGNYSTNGGTEQNPRPWEIGRQGTNWPYPSTDAFPDKKKMPASLGGIGTTGTGTTGTTGTSTTETGPPSFQ